MKRLFLVFLIFSLCSCSVASEFKTSTDTQGVPKIIATKYETDDVVIASYDVTKSPYNADTNGLSDCTKSFQMALDDCYKKGGGVVFAPEGKYLFKGSITIPEGVTLRGDWKEPKDENKKVEGTILMPLAGKGHEEAKPFINITGGSGVTNLNIYYPEQSIENIVPYPPSIQTAAVGDGDHTKERAALNVRNVTFVNSYIGILFSYYDDASSVQFPYSKNIYGTPLKVGVKVSRASAFPRTQGVNFAPEYWAFSGLKNSPDVSTISSYLKKDSVGIDINGNGSGDVSDAYIKDYSIGVLYSDQTPGGSNGKLFGSTIVGANKAVKIAVSDADIFVVSCRLNANTGENPTAVYVDDKAGTGTVFINNCNINTTGSGVYNRNDGYSTNIINSTFEKWGNDKTLYYGIDVAHDIAMIEGNRFIEPASPMKKHILLGNSITNGIVLGNTYAGSPYIDNHSKDSVDINNTPYSFEKFEITSIPKRDNIPKPKKVDTGSLFYVLDYGAKGDGATDNTKAFQTALDKAGKNGGGTVYVPGGKYVIKGHLNIPSGVELRGSQECPFFANNARCILYTYADKNNLKGEPFIKLNSSNGTGSGIRGLFIWYPEQDDVNDYPYPYAIQSQGPNCWVINLAFGNAYNGVDFGSYDSSNHYIESLAGYARNNLLKVSKSKGGGYIANLQTNPTFWKRAYQHSIETFPGKAPLDEELQIDQSGAALILGNVTDEKMVGCFTHGPQLGIHAQNIDGGAPELTAINCGGEVYTWLKIDAAGPKGIQIINGTWHTNDRGKTRQGQPYMIVSEKVGSEIPIRLYSCMNWADTEVGMDIRGGNVLLQQYVSRLRHVPYAPSTTFAKVTGGTFIMENARFTMDIDKHIEQSGSSITKIIGSAALGGFKTSGKVDTLYQPKNSASEIYEKVKKEGKKNDKKTKVK